MSYGDNVTGGGDASPIWIDSTDPAALLDVLQGDVPRVVRFRRVGGSGYFDSAEPFVLSGASNLTIDGGDAEVWLRAPYNRIINCSNILIKNVRFAANQTDLDNGDPLLVTNCAGVRIEHCEFWHSNDDCSFGGNANLQLYRCAFVEPIGDTSQPGEHAFGLFFHMPNDGVLVRECLIAYAKLRNPLFNGGTFHYINNVGFGLADGINVSPSLADININIIGNHYGPNITGTTGQWLRLYGEPYTTTAYHHDNINGMIGNPGEQPSVDEPLDADNLPAGILPASEVREHVLSTVGAWSNGRRHVYLLRVLERIRNGETDYATAVNWPRPPIHAASFVVQ